MLRLILLVVSIALVDSLNPATVGPALFLATGPEGRARVEAFAAGFFVVNLGGGVAIAAGPGQLLLSALPHPSAHTKQVVALIGGIVVIAFAAALWRGRHHVAGLGRSGSGDSRGSAMAMGAGLAALELPTALPYLAIIATVIGSGVSLPEQIGLIALFNVVFVLPLLAMILVLAVARERATELLRSGGDWMRDRAPALLAGLVLLVGLALVGYGARGLIAT